MKLLVAERDPMVRQILLSQASELDVQMIFAQDRIETLAAITSELPDCVVLDASTSSEEEIPLWSVLRQDPQTHDIPLLIYSSSQRWQRVAELAAHQVDAFLPRPFSTQTLLSAAQQITENKLAEA